MQPVTAAQQQQHNAAMAHGAAQALLSSGIGGGGGGNGMPVLRAASLHQQHQYSSGMGGGGEAVFTHTRSIHAAMLPQRFDAGGGGGGTPGGGGSTPTQQRTFSGGGSLMNGLSVHAAQPAGASPRYVLVAFTAPPPSSRHCRLRPDALSLAAPIFAHVAPSPQRLSALGGNMGAYQGLGGGFRGGGGGGMLMQPSPAAPRAGMPRGYAM